MEIEVKEDNPILAVGISGGADSMSLVLMAHNWAQDRGGKVIGLTVNHNLRPGSKEESIKVGELLSHHNIEHHILDWKHPPINSNIQHKARASRLELLTKWCKANNVLHLLLAHNKNDVAETFLMHSMRGSGLYGLSSIPKTSIYNNVLIHRPLLDFKREKLEEYLTQKGAKWIEDPSNSNTKFLRIKVRNMIKKENISVDMLTLSAQNLRRARNFVELQLAQVAGEIVEIHPEGYLTIAIAKFITLHEELALLMLASCLTTISGRHIYKPRLKSLERVYSKIRDGKIKNNTLWGCELHTRKNTLYVYREIPRNGFTLVKTSETTWLWDDRFIITSKTPLLPIEKESRYHRKNIPKKIYLSLPQVKLENIEIDFYPSQPLVKIQFDY